MKIGICDDNTIWCRKAASMIQNYFQQKEQNIECVSAFHSVSEVKQYLKENEDAELDLFFMEIELEGDGHGEQGIALVHEINQIWPECKVVYLSNHLNYALDVYNTDHVYYILKTQLEERLPALYQKILSADKENGICKVFRVKGSTAVSLKLSDIMYFERDLRNTILVARKERYVLTQKLTEIQEYIDSKEFLRCHNSFLINMKHVKTYRRERFTMQDGAEIPVSRHYQNTARETYLTWSAQKVM